jgi:hypothetical protein
MISITESSSSATDEAKRKEIYFQIHAVGLPKSIENRPPNDRWIEAKKSIALTMLTRLTDGCGGRDQ